MAALIGSKNYFVVRAFTTLQKQETFLSLTYNIKNISLRNDSVAAAAEAGVPRANTENNIARVKDILYRSFSLIGINPPTSRVALKCNRQDDRARQSGRMQSHKNGL